MTETINLQTSDDEELFRLRARLYGEMKQRKLPMTVGGYAEQLVIHYFNSTRGLPKLQEARRRIREDPVLRSAIFALEMMVGPVGSGVLKHVC
ncbi:hypothetical protein [Mesorhizobium sp. NZP2298]|uniref:hypothetical protein n=1 Tax=Mesorhizobium sp. NZP2298 TaxID=2483403 RepID=UPI001551CF49|nr:hypothetical protein [Mesorhizobium sp. NZP2298]QKC97162.1 hypothetical protein EB231_22620 [Mesorhizobium sp. NZP2298]